MKESIRQQLLEHYARDIEGLNGEELIAEALASIEAMFSYMDEDDVFKRSRPYAVSYLALCAAQELLSKNVSAGEYQPVKHGRWIMREKDKLIPTGKFAVSEGHILHKTSADKPFNLQSANIIPIKEHKKVKIPYCSICGNYGDDEYDRTPFCPYCGARMGGNGE